MTALIIIIAVIAVLCAVLFVPVLLVFDIAVDGKNINTTVILKFFFLKIVLFPKNKTDKKNNKENKDKNKMSFEDAKNIYGHIKRIYKECKADIADILCYAALKSLTVDELKTNIKFDFENPMHTGIATGVINGVVYNAYSLIDNSVSITKKSVDIEPLFYNTKYFKASIFSIVRLKNVHIMVMLIKLIKVYFKIRKIK